GEMSHGHVSTEIEQNNNLQRFEVAASRNLEGWNAIKVAQFEQSAKKDERDSCRQIRPVTWQQNAGDDNYQRIEKVEKRVNATGYIDHCGGKGQIGEDLYDGLKFKFLPERMQDNKKN